MSRPQKKGPDGLTDQQREFCYQYLLCKYNATEAVRQVTGAKTVTAKSVGSKWMRLEPVKAKIAQLTSKHLGELDLSIKNIARELGIMGFADITQLVNIGEGEVCLKPQDQMGEATKTIQSIEIEDSRQNIGTEEKPVYTGALKTKLKMCDKKGALEILARWRKMLTHVVEHGGTVEVAQAEAFDEAYRRRFGKKASDAKRSRSRRTSGRRGKSRSRAKAGN